MKWSDRFPLPYGDPRSGIYSPSKSDLRSLIALIDAAIAAKADSSSPTFTGYPQVPTPASSDNDSTIPNTEWVHARIAAAVLAAGTGDVVSPGAAALWQRAGAANTTGRLIQYGNTIDHIDRVPFTPSLDLPPYDLARYMLGSRSTIGTYFDRTGLLVTAPANVPRQTFDPVTLEDDGVLIEAAGTNLWTFSEQFDNAAWPKFGNTVVANAVVAPDGTLTADKIIEDTSTGNHRLSRSRTLVSGLQYTDTFFIKSLGRSAIRFDPNKGATSSAVRFDLSNGTIPFSNGIDRAALKYIGNGWWLAETTFTADGTSGTSHLAPTVDYTTSWTGDGVSGIALWGAQFEQAPASSSYIKTTSAAATRAADTLSLPVDSTWCNPSEGTFFLDVTLFSVKPTGTINILQVDDGTTNNCITIRAGAVIANANLVVRKDGATVVDSGSVSLTPMTPARVAITYRNNDWALVLNGGAPVTVASGLVPQGLSRLLLLQGNDAGSKYRRLTYWPKRLSNAQLQALTAA